jgi:putative peptidoglycan lipid II flippase
VSFSATSILARAFYAVGDTRVPMQISVFCLGANVILSLIFALPLQAAGLALANTLTSTANAGLLAYALRRKFPKLDFGELRRDGIRMLTTALVAGTTAWVITTLWQNQLGRDRLWVNLGAVGIPATVAAIVYYAGLWQFGIPACKESLELVTRTLARIRKR